MNTTLGTLYSKTNNYTYINIPQSDHEINYVLFVTFYLVACISAMSMAFEKYGDYMGFYTCNRQIKTSVTFCGKSSNYYCLCTNKNSLATYAGCLTHNHRNSTKQLEKLVSFCKRYGGVDVEEHWFDNAYQNFC